VCSDDGVHVLGRSGLSARFEEAFSYAAGVHRDQVRKGTPIPYVSHLLSVAALVLEDGGDEDVLLADIDLSVMPAAVAGLDYLAKRRPELSQ
jgi:hypothetical protein